MFKTSDANTKSDNDSNFKAGRKFCFIYRLFLKGKGTRRGYSARQMQNGDYESSNSKDKWLCGIAQRFTSLQREINFCKLFLSWKWLNMASDFPIEYFHLVQQLLTKDQELISRKQEDSLLIFTSSKSNNIKPAS